MIGLWLALGWSVSAAGPAPPPADLEQRVAQAKELYRLGAGLYEAGRYQEAIGTFREAHELSGNPKLLFNVANAQERLGQLQDAVDSLLRYRPFATPEEQVALDLRISALMARMEPVAPPEPEPTGAPELPPVRRAPRRGPRWAVVGVGGAVGVGFTTLASVSYLQGRAARDAGDSDAYASSRALNNVSIPAAGVGAAVALLGVALPRPARARVSVGPRGLRLTLPL
ncbi:MAG: tetratricopeptide repeat protein [Myxococcales bacterium]|nr:tetratricopeptide repeat protein [Myxococcales bacterium]